MRAAELMRLVWLNINQNKFKSILTSIGIVVGAATIVLVIGIGKGGQMEVAEQFAELNAGAIDVTYEYEGEEESGGGFSFGNIGAMLGGMFGGFQGGRGAGDSAGEDFRADDTQGGFAFGGGGGAPGEESFSGEGGTPGEEGFPQEGVAPGEEGFPQEGVTPGEEDVLQEDGTPGENGEAVEEDTGEAEAEEAESETSGIDDRLNQEKVLLTQEDAEDIERYVSGIDGVTLSYSTRASVEGGDLTSAQTYTVAGVKENYLEVSKLEMAQGEFLTQENDEAKERVCVLGASAAQELFAGGTEALGSTVYIEDRTYTVAGILKSSQTVSAGISPDTAIMIPYETGIKYITGSDIDPTLTVIAQDVDSLESVIEDVRTVLEESHINARFTFEDSGSKMQAAQSSNRILTMLLSAMAAIVFLVGGIGIMNVLFVSVKERTNEIGILKALGTPRENILAEFLVESAAISLLGGVLGVLLSFGVIPVAKWLEVRVETDISACLIALGFAVLTGTVFGIYPAWKASRLEPVEALNAE